MRTSSRLGQSDWDVQRLRYNQFIRMLQKKGGWEVGPELSMTSYELSLPYRWTVEGIDAMGRSAEQLADTVVKSVQQGGGGGGGVLRNLDEGDPFLRKN